MSGEGGNMPDINMAPGAEEAGLPAMMADMIKANLKNRPERIKDFNALNGNIYIQAEDAGVDMTMAFSKGSLTVHSGRVRNTPTTNMVEMIVAPGLIISIFTYLVLLVFPGRFFSAGFNGFRI